MKDQYREFYETLGMKYPEDRIVYNTLSGILRKKWILDKLATMPAGNLLDCGCNIGTLSKEWRRGRVVGVDISLNLLRMGQKIAPHTDFVQADLRDLGMFKRESIDNAIACEVVEHLDKPNLFFDHLAGIIKKGGRVLITAPNFSRYRPTLVPLGIMESFGVTKGTTGTKYLHTAYKPGELAAMAGAAGFTVVEQGSFEHELRGWLKPASVLEKSLGILSTHFFPTSRLNRLIERAITRIEVNAYAILDMLFLSRILKHLFEQGRRSYIVAVK
jgi:2-polyprenyl-3-methyl-5-hydroxy-6-metoxy-1,4-benzoquinol methylase